MSNPTVETLTGAVPMPTQTGLNGSTTSTLHVTTTSANLLVVYIIAPQQSSGAGTLLASVADGGSAGLTFTKVLSVASSFNTPTVLLEIYTAPITTPLSNEPLTVTSTWNGGATNGTQAIAFGIIGAGAIDFIGGSVVESGGSFPQTSVTYSTTNANDLVLYIGTQTNVSGQPDPGVPTGFTKTYSALYGSGNLFPYTDLGSYVPGVVQSGVVVDFPANLPAALWSTGEMAVMAVSPPTNATVPNVVGDTVAAATTAITAVGLVVGTTSYTTLGTPGEVYSQSPTAGSTVTIGSAVNLVVCSADTVPNVVGDTLTAATTAITTAGLVVGTISYTSSGTPGTVYSQSPASGTVVSPGTAVNLVITYPPIPNVVGDTLAAATTALAAVSLTVGTVTYTSSGTVGTVYSQSPAAGTVATPGNTENLVITYCAVPNVVGDTQAAATSAITAALLTLGTVTSAVNAVPAGNVISQSPTAGVLEPPSSPVNISVSLGPNPSGTAYLQAKFVPASVGAAIMIANPGNIHPRITPPERDTTVRIDPSWRHS